jgi:antirestriction protein ArdC
MAADLYDRITASIIAALEKGSGPWHQPWTAGDRPARPAARVRPRRHNGEPYRGINVLMLWAAASAAGYASTYWMTYRQAVELDAHVRKGEKGELVVFASTFTRTGTDAATGQDTEENIPFLKGYTVFNAEQIEGLPERFHPVPAAVAAPPILERLPRADAFFTALGADIRHGGDKAFYSPATDHIQMPAFGAFRDADAYYGTLAHECVHWTKEPSRLNRDFGRKRWGDHGYATEELVAELGAAFVAADLGLASEPRSDHASYIASWLEVLQGDKRAIFTAASHAQRAADYLAQLQKSSAAAA